MRAGFLFSIMIWFHVLSLHKSYYASFVDILWRHLKRMGLCETDVSHPVFGNAKQALETLVQQRSDFLYDMEYLFLVLLSTRVASSRQITSIYP